MPCLSALLPPLLLARALGSLTLRDEKLSATFSNTPDATFGGLSDLHAVGGENVLDTALSVGLGLWSATFAGAAKGGLALASHDAVCAGRIVDPVNETQAFFKWAGCGVGNSRVNVTLEATLASGELRLALAFHGDGNVALWDYSARLGNLQSTGRSLVKTGAASQLLGLWGGDGDAVYFAAHDVHGGTKTCDVGKGRGTGCSVVAVGAGLPLHSYDSVPFAVAVIPRGDWWDLASHYRSWAVAQARWMRAPLAQRSDLPDWLENITLWMNNNWGGDPLSPPNNGGDPEHVKEEFLRINAKLGLGRHGGVLALHWYEWDLLGYTDTNYTKCDRQKAPCGFDTHYPNYFPAREGCAEAVKAMQAEGMRVVPYINGQLFDTLIARWKTENASLAVQKLAVAPRMQPTPLQPHLEYFDKVVSAVMCPATAYWSNVMRETIVKIVDELGFDGCYVDQVGNGEKRTCYDPSHNHLPGGGSFWSEAFETIMANVRSTISRPSMFMTEGIVEEVAGKAFDIMLGLDIQDPHPYWHAIFGGYGYATGYAGGIAKPLGHGLAAQLTRQFMFGGTMGWLTYQHYGETWFDPANAAEVAYIVKLSEVRIAAKAWMVHGRSTRDVPNGNRNLVMSCFVNEVLNTLACAVAAPQVAGGAFSLELDAARYGMVVPEGARLVVKDVLTGQELARLEGPMIKHAGELRGFDVTAISVETVAPELERIVV